MNSTVIPHPFSTSPWILAFAGMTAGLSFTASVALAQAAPKYPSKPIRVLVPSPPGSGSDLMTRAVTQKLSERLGQSVVADNRPGAAGAIALDTLQHATPDGYTLGTLSAQNVTAMLMKTIPVDIPNAFSPIALMISQPYLLVATPSLPVTSVKELIAYAKTKPLVYASSGVGSVVHLGMEMLKTMAGIEMTHVPYKGSGLSMVDLMGGRVQVAITNTLTATPLVRSGKIKAIAVTSAQRTQAMPELPTIAESGLPNYELRSWYGLVAPKKTPPAVIQTVNQTIGSIMMLPDVRERLATDGAEAAPAHSPEQFRSTIANEIKRWDAFLKRAQLKLD
ncbi:MAG TPA: tripartite tricarboxylate transporter substrate binding protein [Burkholderiales bacterium]|nr:tripartite tricarboxylate transporter substrate binding protein [Burkholderiales bacterium]